MAIWKRWLSRPKPAAPGAPDAERLSPRLLRGIGVDPIASGSRREARLWQQLAA